jgi:GAF domain-containing protein
LALPLVVGDNVLGALDVQSTQPAAFSEDDIAVLQLVADQVAVALQNARLFDAVQQALEAERRAYGEQSRRSWIEIIRGGQAPPGYMSDGTGLHQTNVLGQPHVKAALWEGKQTPGSNGSTSLAVPIRVRDQVIGVIDAQKPDGSGEWVPQEIELLQTLTEQLGVALDSARFHEDTRRRAARDRLIGEVTGRMRETLDVEVVLRTAVNEIAASMGLAALDIRLSMDDDKD